MKFFDDDVNDGFDAMFDWNRDGKLDSVERAMKYMYIDKTMKDMEDEEDDEDNLFDGDDDF